MKMSQFREGIFGRLESQDWGMPVYLRAAFMPDSWAWGAVGPAALADIGSATSRTPSAQFGHGSRFGGCFQSREIGIRRSSRFGFTSRARIRSYVILSLRLSAAACVKCISHVIPSEQQKNTPTAPRKVNRTSSNRLSFGFSTSMRNLFVPPSL